MACVHLRRLYQLCQEENLRLSGSDLIHIVCQQCGVQEVCPSAFVEEIDADGEPDLVLACDWGPIRVLRKDLGLKKGIRNRF